MSKAYKIKKHRQDRDYAGLRRGPIPHQRTPLANIRLDTVPGRTAREWFAIGRKKIWIEVYNSDNKIYRMVRTTFRNVVEEGQIV